MSQVIEREVGRVILSSEEVEIRAGYQPKPGGRNLVFVQFYPEGSGLPIHDADFLFSLPDAEAIAALLTRAVERAKADYSAAEEVDR